MEEYLEFAISIAKYAGNKIREGFSNELELNYKSDKTVVTEIDKDINHYLIQKVKEKYVSVFSLALVVNGEVQVGVVYDPYFDKIYTAIKGKGAYCNGDVIHVNNLHLGDLGYRLNYEMWDKARYDTMMIARDLLPSVKVSSIGSVARACIAVASGYFSCDLFPGVAHGNCDIAASSLIVEEAGGKVTDFEGHTQRYDEDINGAIISNGKSHDEVLEYVKGKIK